MDPLMLLQKEDHLLQHRGWQKVMETTGSLNLNPKLRENYCHLTFPPAVHELPPASILTRRCFSQKSLFFCFWHVVCHIVVFTLISLLNNNTEHFSYVNLLPVYHHVWLVCYICPIFITLFIFLYFWDFLICCHLKPHQICVLLRFHTNLCLPFHFFNSDIWRQVFNFDASNLSGFFFSFLDHDFGIMSKLLLPNPRSKLFFCNGFLLVLLFIYF